MRTNAASSLIYLLKTISVDIGWGSWCDRSVTAFHLAQLNVARMRMPLDDPGMAGFTGRLDEINALADSAPGFVWRLVDDEGASAVGLRPFGPDFIVNLSVWDSLHALHDFTYRTAHLDVLRTRRDWFHAAASQPHLVLWWRPAHIPPPNLDEAGKRLELLADRGPTGDAFTFRDSFPAPE